MEFDVIKTVGANSYTGSIERVYSLADGLEADSTGSNALARVEFGRFTPGGTNTPTSTVDSAVYIPKGTYLEGPIQRLKVSNGPFLIYFLKH